MIHAATVAQPKHRSQAHARQSDLLDAVAWLLMPLVFFYACYAAWRMLCRAMGFKRNTNQKERE
jgi:cytochrome c oxidase assembly protein Cox11